VRLLRDELSKHDGERCNLDRLLRVRFNSGLIRGWDVGLGDLGLARRSAQYSASPESLRSYGLFCAMDANLSNELSALPHRNFF
jgi:hypothetical protein